MATNQKFGNGFYFSPELNKSLNYSSDENNSDNFCILLCKVVMGNTFRPKSDDSHLFEFDLTKYDSLHATPK